MKRHEWWIYPGTRPFLVGLAVAMLLLALTGCASITATDEEPVDRFLDEVLEIKVEDVKSAHTLAIIAGDPAGKQCYPVLLQWVEIVQSYRKQIEPIKGDGPLTTHQRIRNVKRGVTRGVYPETVRVACAAMLDGPSWPLLRILSRVR